MPDNFVFGGINTLSYGAYAFSKSRYQIPEKDIEFEQIPGRLGDIVLGGKRLQNEEWRYGILLVPTAGYYGSFSTMDAAFSALRHALLSTNGYATLTDSFDTSHYRKAVFIGADEPEISKDKTLAKFNLIFSCKPQRFFNVAAISVAADVTKQALATFPAATANCEPIIEVTGTGDFYFYTGPSETQVAHITVSQNPDTVTIDCQRKECYYSGGSANQWVTFDNYKFPALGPFFGNAGAVKVTTNGVSLSIDPGAYLL